MNLEPIDPGGLYPVWNGKGEPTGPEEVSYCDGMLWRYALADLSCDFGPLERASSYRLKKRSSGRRKKKSRNKNRSAREDRDYEIGGIPEYDRDFPGLELEFPDFGDIDGLDSGGTFCKWTSSLGPVAASPDESAEPATAWTLKRLYGGLEEGNTDYYPMETIYQPQLSSSVIEPGRSDSGGFFEFFYPKPAPLRSQRSPVNHPIDDPLKSGPPFDHTTSGTTGDGFYAIFNTSSGVDENIDRPLPTIKGQLYSPYFTNPFADVCMKFRYFIHVDKPILGKVNGGLLVYLLPCNPSYRIPVLNLTGSNLINKTDQWKLGVAPLPDHKQPYQAIFEAVGVQRRTKLPTSRSDSAESQDEEDAAASVLYVTLDDIVFTHCGKYKCEVT